jgi:anti-anti-sigma factor
MRFEHVTDANGTLQVWRFVGPGLYVVRLEGELGLGTTGALQAELERAVAQECERILIDLGEVRFIDSTGIWTLLKAQRASDEHKHGLAFVRPSGGAETVVGMVGLDRQLRFLDWPSELLEAPDSALS